MAHRTAVGGVAAGRNKLLALDIRPQEFGFVVFDGAACIVDRGMRSAFDWRNRQIVVARTAVCRLLDFHRPGTVVLCRRGRTANAFHVAAVVRAEAKRRSVPCHALSVREVTHFFAPFGCATKHEIALLLAEWFRELSWTIPPKRKLWQSEPRLALIFDAVAVGIAFHATREPEPQ